MSELRKAVTDYIDALESGDSKRLAEKTKHLNQVGFTPTARRAEIERQAKERGNAKLIAAIELIKKVEEENPYPVSPRRAWSINDYWLEQAMEHRRSRWWQNLD